MSTLNKEIQGVTGRVSDHTLYELSLTTHLVSFSCYVSVIPDLSRPGTCDCLTRLDFLERSSLVKCTDCLHGFLVKRCLRFLISEAPHPHPGNLWIYFNHVIQRIDYPICQTKLST